VARPRIEWPDDPRPPRKLRHARFGGTVRGCHDARIAARAALLISSVLAILIVGATAGAQAATGPPTLAALLRSDASAKELAHTAQTAAEVYATEHDGSYAGLTVARAAKLLPGLRRSATARLIFISAHASSFRLTARSDLTSQRFSIAVGPSGKVKRTCSIGLACPTGAW
jgi:hypothetical protein